MSLRSLAESIILQALEDLDDPNQRTESMSFFQGRRFRHFARLAGIRKEDVSGFHAYAMQYASAIYGRSTRQDARRRNKTRESLMYGHPLSMHITGRCQAFH